MARILFVDDENNVLSGLRRMLRAKRRQWDMEFVNNGAEAIGLLETGAFDAVVCDLMMPGVDGLHVLEAFRDKAPETVRIALSGFADKNTTLRAVAQIHQFLTKPCDAETLRGTLERALELAEFLQDPRLRKITSEMETLPSLASLFEEVEAELDSSEMSSGELGKKVARDPGMSAKVLQLVNSALFGLPQVVSDPVQATVLLGLDTMRILIFTVRIFELFDDEHTGGLDPAALWDHSVETAHMAKRLCMAETASERMAECAYLGGLLHDVGKLVVARNMPEKYQAVIRLSQKTPGNPAEIERRILGASHAEIGGYLIGLWGFSEEILEAIALHHQPGETKRLDFSPLTAVHVANVLANARESGNEDGEALPLDEAYLERLGLLDRLPTWRAMCSEHVG